MERNQDQLGLHGDSSLQNNKERQETEKQTLALGPSEAASWGSSLGRICCYMGKFSGTEKRLAEAGDIPGKHTETR